jgi:hypothetical protein
VQWDKKKRRRKKIKKENTNICDVGKSVTREEAEIADKPLGNRSV